MAEIDRLRWDEKHAESGAAERPSSFLRQIFAGDRWQIPRGRALDVACGKGRNALYLAALGFDVLAVDISAVALEEAKRRALERSLAVDWVQADMEKFCLPAEAFDLVIDFNYLQRSLFPALKGALRVGGYVIFETYLIDQKGLGHPQNSDYLLRHNELLDRFRDFRALFYREGRFVDGGAAAYRAGLCAQKTR